jgi:hypothetical protein
MLWIVPELSLKKWIGQQIILHFPFFSFLKFVSYFMYENILKLYICIMLYDDFEKWLQICYVHFYCTIISHSLFFMFLILYIKKHQYKNNWYQIKKMCMFLKNAITRIFLLTLLLWCSFFCNDNRPVFMIIVHL